MKERPILFSGAMVRALLAGTKTQTRRVLKPQPELVNDVTDSALAMYWTWQGRKMADLGRDAVMRMCPYGQPGDKLWVRETFAEGIHQMADVNHWAYAADHFGAQQRLGDRWKPSIHMPRAASRITLEVTSVRAERLQDISEADAQAEGCALECMTPTGDDNGSAIYGPGGYLALWESINGPGSWDANPWVWVVSFQPL